MAEIKLDPLSIEGNGFLHADASSLSSSAVQIISSSTISNKAILVTRTDSEIISAASLSGRIILVKASKVSTAANSTVSSKGRVIKYISSRSIARASVKSSAKKYKTARAALATESTFEAFTYDRDIQASYENYLPKLYAEFEDVTKMMQVEANEATRLAARINSIIDQPFVNSATYALDRWEKELGIKPIPQRSLDSRRHYILAKLRGLGTTTSEVLKAIADSFYESEIIENPHEYAIEVKIVGRRGRPKNAEDMQETIEEVIPAHISHSIAFTFLPWNELDMIRRSWTEVESLKMGDTSSLAWRKFEGIGAKWNNVSDLTGKELEESYNLNTGGTDNE